MTFSDIAEKLAVECLTSPQLMQYICLSICTLLEDENKQDVINRYRKQLDLYADALTKLSGKKVKEKYLYLFNIDKEVKL